MNATGTTSAGPAVATADSAGRLSSGPVQCWSCCAHWSSLLSLGLPGAARVLLARWRSVISNRTSVRPAFPLPYIICDNGPLQESAVMHFSDLLSWLVPCAFSGLLSMARQRRRGGPGPSRRRCPAAGKAGRARAGQAERFPGLTRHGRSARLTGGDGDHGMGPGPGFLHPEPSSPPEAWFLIFIARWRGRSGVARPRPGG